MKLSSEQNKAVFNDPKQIILYHLQNIKISEESFNRYGDKNKITKGLRALYLTKKGGYPLDKFVKGYLEDLPNMDEKEKIEATVETMIYFDSKAKIDDYFKANKTVKVSSIKQKPVNITDAKPCLVKASLRHMSRKELREELNNLISSPSAYFGKLLEVNECKTDLFTVSEKQQVQIAKAMLKQLYEEETQKPKISLGKQKPLNLGYGDTLKAQSAYSNFNTDMKAKPKYKAGDKVKMKNGKVGIVTDSQIIKDPSIKTKTLGYYYDLKDLQGKKIPVSRSESGLTKLTSDNNMKAKKTTKKSTTPKRKKGVSVAQQKAQSRIKRISDEATKIQKAGGKKTIPAKTVYTINRADAVKKAAKKIK